MAVCSASSVEIPGRTLGTGNPATRGRIVLTNNRGAGLSADDNFMKTVF